MVVSRDREGLINRGSFRVGCCCHRRRAGLAGLFSASVSVSVSSSMDFCCLGMNGWMDGWVDGCFTLFSFFWWERFIKLGGSLF